MQPYERIGLVALMFLVVLLAVGALWDDGSTEDTVLAAERSEIERVDEEAANRERARIARKEEKIRAAQETASGVRSRTNSGSARSMVMGGQDELGTEVSRVTTLSSGAGHRSEPKGFDMGGDLPDLQPAPAARAQTPEELQGLGRPNRGRSASLRSDAVGAETVSMNARSARRGSAAKNTRSKDAARNDQGSSASQPEPSAPSRVAAVSRAEEPKATQPKAPKARTYTVKPGDALQRIAQAELGAKSLADEIASLNGLANPNMIRAGMVLTLPPRTDASVAAAANPAASASGSRSATAVAPAGSGSSFTIRSGESLGKALERELGTYSRSISLVKALNPGLNPDRVRAGQVIYLPRREDIPPAKKGKSSGGSKAKSRSGAPALNTAPASSRVASVDRRSTSKSARSESEFVVR